MLNSILSVLCKRLAIRACYLYVFATILWIRWPLKLGRPHSTVDSVLALHPAAPSSNLGRGIFSILLSFWTVLRSNPSSAEGNEWISQTQCSEGLRQVQQKVFLKISWRLIFIQSFTQRCLFALFSLLILSIETYSADFSLRWQKRGSGRTCVSYMVVTIALVCW